MPARKGSALLVVLLALAFARRSSATPARPAPAPPPGPPTPRPTPAPAPSGGAPTLARVNTGGASWARDRKEAIGRALNGADDTEVGLSILAQWAFETAAGRAEWNNNVGNLKAFGAQPRVDLGSAGLFRAFDTLDEGVKAYFALVQNAKFKPAFDLLVADPLSDAWVRKLGALGYYEGSQDAYAAGWSAQRAKLAPEFFP